MSTRVKLFIILLTVLILGGVGVWFAWQAYAWPVVRLSNGWQMRIARSWTVVDVSEVPELSRPLLFVQSDDQHGENRLTIHRRPYPAANLDAFVQEQRKEYAVAHPEAKVLGHGYLREKNSSLPYIYQQANGVYAITMMASKDGVTYYVEATYTKDVSSTFGQGVIKSLRSLR